ncbi:MAG: hypothetical protein FWE28_01695 [Oscillospiraceae bacterium]|nr:hypothetical protein [Oscillospiraceae bacterium]
MDIENGVFLLAKNLLPEDEKLLYDAVKSFRPHRNKGDWHGVYINARDGIEAMRGKPTDEILGECRFDANGDIRVFAERLNRNRNRSK